MTHLPPPLKCLDPFLSQLIEILLLVRIQRFLKLAPDARSAHCDVQHTFCNDRQRAGVLGRIHGDHDPSLLALSELEDPAGSDVVSRLDLDWNVFARFRELLYLHVERQFSSELRPSEINEIMRITNKFNDAS